MQDNIKVQQDALNKMEDVYEVTVLLDFYGQLLTRKQYEVLDFYYNNDLSLGEIAEYLSISRQGVFDSIRKAKKSLFLYEKKLRLVERFREQEKNVEMALVCLKDLAKQAPDINQNTNYNLALDILEKISDTL
jgi:predicted DNA-binding protein YlxM (UPF0122 family)